MNDQLEIESSNISSIARHRTFSATKSLADIL